MKKITSRRKVIGTKSLFATFKSSVGRWSLRDREDHGHSFTSSSSFFTFSLKYSVGILIRRPYAAFKQKLACGEKNEKRSSVFLQVSWPNTLKRICNEKNKLKSSRNKPRGIKSEGTIRLDNPLGHSIRKYICNLTNFPNKSLTECIASLVLFHFDMKIQKKIRKKERKKKEIEPMGVFFHVSLLSRFSC